MRIDCRGFWTMTPYVYISFLPSMCRTSVVYGLCIILPKYRGNSVVLTRNSSFTIPGNFKAPGEIPLEGLVKNPFWWVSTLATGF